MVPSARYICSLAGGLAALGNVGHLLVERLGADRTEDRLVADDIGRRAGNAELVGQRIGLLDALLVAGLLHLVADLVLADAERGCDFERTAFGRMLLAAE